MYSKTLKQLSAFLTFAFFKTNPLSTICGTKLFTFKYVYKLIKNKIKINCKNNSNTFLQLLVLVHTVGITDATYKHFFLVLTIVYKYFIKSPVGDLIYKLLKSKFHITNKKT